MKHVCKGLLLGLLVMVVALSLFACPATEEPTPEPTPAETVSVIFKNGDTTAATKTVDKGTALTAADIPAAPVVEGKTFLGWYIGDTKVEAGYTVNADATATARFEDITYTLTFRNGDETVATITVKHGATPAEDALPADPEKAGYAFDGWKAGDVAFDETKAVTGDATYTAAFTKTHYFVVFKNGTDETLVLVPMDNAALTAEMIPATPEAADGSACTGWFAGDVKAEVGTVIAADTTFEPHFVAAEAFAGAYADIENGEFLTITEALAVSGKATGTAVLAADGTLSWKVGGTTYTVALTANGVTLTVNAYDAMEEDFVDTVYTMARLSAVEGLAGTYKFSRTTKYTVNELGVITGYNNNSSAPYFGLVTKNEDGTLTISLKTSASGKVSAYAVTVDEKGSWVVSDGYAKIYVKADADAQVKAYYNSTTKEYIHVFYLKAGSTEEKVVTYTVGNDKVCIYATIEGTIGADSIVTYTAGEKTATIKLGKTSTSDMSFVYPTAERGKSYAGTLGEITLDGFGTAKVGDAEKTYVLNGNKLILDGGESAVVLTEATEEGGKGTYVVLDKDAYAGTYIIYNDYAETKNYTIILDGFGTITLKGKSSSTVGTYTVGEGTITVANCSSYNGEWTVLAGHDGKALRKGKYDLVLNTYAPDVTDAIATLLGNWADAKGNKITVYWWDAASCYAIDGFGSTTLRLTPYWDGSALVDEDWQDTCSAYPKVRTTALIITRDGDNLVISHTCLRMDEYDEEETVAVSETYTAAAEDPFAFEESLRGNWKTEDGAYKLVIGETTLTLNGVEATAVSGSEGSYEFTVDGTTYTIYDYYGVAWKLVVGRDELTLETDVAIDPSVTEIPAAMQGTWTLKAEDPWETSGYLIHKMVITATGVVYTTEGDYPSETTYTFTSCDVNGTVTITAENGDTFALTLKDGKLNAYQNSYVDLTLEQLDAFAGTWTYDTLVWEFDGKGTVKNEKGDTYDYTIKDGKATFANSAYTITATFNSNGTLKVHYDDGYGEDVFDKTFTKQADTEEEELDAFAGTWKGVTGTLTIDGKGNYEFNGVKGTYTIDSKGVATVADATIHGFDEDPMTFTLKDGKLTMAFTQDYEGYSKEFTKEA